VTTPRLADLDAAACGADVLDLVQGQLTRFVSFPSSETADAVTLYIAATHAQPAWQHATRLVIKSAEKRCGKTRLMEIAKELVHQPLPAANISAAALVRSICEDDPPTFVIDEADRVFGDRQAETAEIITGILNAGFARGWPYVRWDVLTRQREDCPTFAMAMLASKGVDLPDTIEDRAVIVVMRRQAPGEKAQPFRHREIPALRAVRARLRGWVASCAQTLGAAEPVMPVEDRAADVWEPLVAIADAAGGSWPQRARTAARILVAESDQADVDASLGVRLLADIRDLFTDWTVHFMASRELVSNLRKVEDAPWNDLDLTTRGLADRLRLYGVRPGRNTTGDARGYRLEDFLDPFRRYLPVPAQPPPASEPVNSSETPVDLGIRSDSFPTSDTSNRQIDATRQTHSPRSDLELTGSDASGQRGWGLRVRERP
jgi:hypothetical protein